MPADRAQHPSGPGEVRDATALRSVVVVGAGLAGSQSVAALREQGFDGRITVVGSEELEPYDRPPLSKGLLSRTEPAWLRDELGTDLTALADEVLLGATATALSTGPDGVTVTIRRGPRHSPHVKAHADVDSGAVVSTNADVDPIALVDSDALVKADVVVLATGAHAVRPRGWESGLTLHTWSDAVRLRARLVPGARLVVVGAGWIGAEVAGVAVAAGVDVTVVEAAPAPLAAALGTDVGGLTVPWYAAAGVRLLLGSTVTSVTEGAVVLATGETIPADVILVAVGARPTSSWLRGALSIGPDGSLAVDEGYAVLESDGSVAADGRVVAVGDLARRRSPRHGWVPGGHWDGALRGPAHAVHTLLGSSGRSHQRPPVTGPAPQSAADPAPYVFSTQLGHELALFGLPGPADDVVLRGDPAQGLTALWFTAGTEQLTAILSVDRPREVGSARRLFTDHDLPRLDRSLAADPAVPLKSALRAD